MVHLDTLVLLQLKVLIKVKVSQDFEVNFRGLLGVKVYWGFIPHFLLFKFGLFGFWKGQRKNPFLVGSHQGPLLPIEHKLVKQLSPP
jgi:hypothetical protein